MYDDASDARKRAAPAISCNSPHRPIGILATNAAYCAGSFSNGRFISVANGPGHRAFTVTPRPAHSNASVRVSPRRPAFDDAYGVRPAMPMADKIDPR